VAEQNRSGSLIELGCGLVEHDEGRPTRYCGRDRQSLLLATRQLCRTVMKTMPETEQLEDVRDRSAGTRSAGTAGTRTTGAGKHPVAPAHPKRELNVVRRIEIWKQVVRGVREDVADVGPHESPSRTGA
jgi:hypothetical protein